MVSAEPVGAGSDAAEVLDAAEYRLHAPAFTHPEYLSKATSEWNQDSNRSLSPAALQKVFWPQTCKDGEPWPDIERWKQRNIESYSELHFAAAHPFTTPSIDLKRSR